MITVSTTKLSSKGQVVIPEDIRTRLGLKPGVQFIVLCEGDLVVLKTIGEPTSEEFSRLLAQARKQGAVHESRYCYQRFHIWNLLIRTAFKDT